MKCALSAGTGKEEWGAEKGKQYFILTVHEILKGGTDGKEEKQTGESP